MTTTSRTKAKSAPSAMLARTPTDPGGAMPTLTDTVILLRVWGSYTFFKLSIHEKAEITIGSAPTCRIRLDAKHVSKLHASLRFEGGRWILRDLASHNGMFLGGWPETEIALSPGTEITLGGVTLIAESARSNRLRDFLRRVIGSSDEKLEPIDLAMRAIRATASRLVPLALYGDDDLVSVAYDIHRLAFSETKPFIVCDPSRSTSDRSRRGVRVVSDLTEARNAAVGGTLCVWTQPKKRRPVGLDMLRDVLTKPGGGAQFVLCGHNERAVRQYGATPIEILSPRGRDGEIEQIIRDYGADARASLQTSLELRPKDRQWVRKYADRSLGEMQKLAERFLALKHFGNYSQAADWLGLSVPALTQWMETREIVGVPK